MPSKGLAQNRESFLFPSLHHRKEGWPVFPFIITLVLIASTILAGTVAPQFVDITKQSGIQFIHNNGAFGKKYLPETLGAGAAFLDFNNDGFQDILFVNGRDWTPSAPKKTTAKLYRNNGNGTFTDATAGSGLDISIYGMGAAAADYDNDGRVDIYITAIDGDHLFITKATANSKK